MAGKGEEVATSIDAQVREAVEKLVGEIRSSIEDIRVSVDQQLTAALQSVQADVNSFSFLPQIQKTLGDLQGAGAAAKAPAGSDAGTMATDLDLLADYVHTESVPHAAIIDCTASAEIASRYGDWLAKGIHVITPNKKANSGDIEYYRELQQAARRADAHYFYETTVGAALPVIQTLRDLVQTGDEVHRIEGVFSGTLSYLFNSFDGSTPFSGIVAAAREKGYTEPDPREDLSGMDVARKVVILDCCYSGRAIEGGMGTARANQTVTEGSHVLTASDATKRAWSPPGENGHALHAELAARALEPRSPLLGTGVEHGPERRHSHGFDTAETERRPAHRVMPGGPIDEAIGERRRIHRRDQVRRAPAE